MSLVNAFPNSGGVEVYSLEHHIFAHKRNGVVFMSFEASTGYSGAFEDGGLVLTVEEELKPIQTFSFINPLDTNRYTFYSNGNLCVNKATGSSGLTLRGAVTYLTA